MKIITIKGNKHYIYESDTEFRANYPNEPIRELLSELEEGEWIRSEQGYIVQCLQKRTYIDKSKGNGARKTPRMSYYFKFPRYSKAVRQNKLNTHLFYFPTSDHFVSEHIESYPLAHKPKVKMFITYVQKGLSPDMAYMRAFGKYSLRKTTFLLSRQDVLDAITKGGEFMKDELERAGLSKAAFAEEIVKIVKNTKENAVVRKWALETVNGVLNNVQAEAHDNFDPILQASIQNN